MFAAGSSKPGNRPGWEDTTGGHWKCYLKAMCMCKGWKGRESRVDAFCPGVLVICWDAVRYNQLPQTC